MTFKPFHPAAITAITAITHHLDQPLDLIRSPQLMKTYADYETPDKILARTEAWHPEDYPHTDHQLDPEDIGETFDAAGIKGIPLDALRQLLLFLIPKTTDRGSRWKMATVRLAIVARILNIDDAGRVPLEMLAKQIGVTRSLLSLRQLEIADQFQLGKLRSSRSASARKAYSISATNVHRRAQERRQIESGTDMHQTTAKPT